MSDARHTPPQGESEYFEIDGVYLKINDRLRGLVSLLATGCSEAELQFAVDAIKPGRTYAPPQLRELLDRLFVPHGLQVDDLSLTSYGRWRLRATPQAKEATGLESALTCRVTLIPEKLANRVAQSFKFLFLPFGACLAMVLCIAVILRYVSVFGLESLSLHALFAAMHSLSAASVAIAIAAVLWGAFFHEFGHCAAVAAFGSRVRRIGFGIYWLSPALFSDVSGAWTLTRWQRVAVDCGGIYFQVVLCNLYAAVILLTHSRSVQLGLRVAIAGNLFAILAALNPILKCDGYWILSDAMAIPNLRRESERAMRACVRSLIGKRVSQPPAPTAGARFLIGYGLLSLVFGALMMVLFINVVCHNAVVASLFPRDAWNLLWGGQGTGELRPKLSHLALELWKAVPVICAPMALFTAVSGLRRFAGRTSAQADRKQTP